ncbi:MAG: hypothetical protein JWP78_3165 [Mucilaginibacter sp.]|nr:hypothetical protein [Mucilaginibacter sp.]
MLIGWSLINSSIKTPHFLKMQKMILLFKEQGLIPINAKVALGQKYLDYEYRGKGIMDLATIIQEELTFSNFEIYLSTVQKFNKRSEFFFKKNSFQQIYQDNVRYYLTKAIVKRGISVYQSLLIGNGSSATKVMIRPGEAGDEFQLHELNKKRLKENLTDLSQGFLTSLYTASDFRQMINLQEIIVIAV